MTLSAPPAMPESTDMPTQADMMMEETTTPPEAETPSVGGFAKMNLNPKTLKGLEKMGFENPSPIQEQAIPVFMTGVDVIAQAQTGTGKTAAFAIPMIEQLDTKLPKIQAVVLCPTRELAVQVTEECRKIGKFHNISTVSIYGGQPMERQFMALKSRPQIIVATPGRLLDHLYRGSIELSAVKLMVLDEADEMLDMGFKEDIETIMEFQPKGGQRVLFSATLPPEIVRMANTYLNNPERVTVKAATENVALIDQFYVHVPHPRKSSMIAAIMKRNQQRLGLVFCNTQRDVENVSNQLNAEGIRAEGLHGGMPQSKRDRVMNRFRKGGLNLMVATDVAARGIDVQGVEVVFNYDLPRDTEKYTHRIGRTGRAGNSGHAYSLISPAQVGELKNLMRKLPKDVMQHITAEGVKAPDDMMRGGFGYNDGGPNGGGRRRSGGGGGGGNRSGYGRRSSGNGGGNSGYGGPSNRSGGNSRREGGGYSPRGANSGPNASSTSTGERRIGGSSYGSRENTLGNKPAGNYAPRKENRTTEGRSPESRGPKADQGFKKSFGKGKPAFGKPKSNGGFGGPSAGGTGKPARRKPTAHRKGQSPKLQPVGV